MKQDGVEIIPEKGNTEPKYSVRSIVLSEEDLTEVNEKEGMRSTLHIRHARGSDTANVSLHIILKCWTLENNNRPA